MKILKAILWLVLVLIVVYLILCLVAPKQLQVERSRTMNAPARMIFSHVNDLEKWDNWNPWKEMDPGMEQTLAETTEGVGASVSWKSESQGNGSQKIVASEPYSHVRTELKFDDWDGVSYGDWKFEELGPDSTKVTWSMDTEVTAFLMRAMTLFMKGMLVEQYDKGLASLQDVVEALPKAPPVEVFQTHLNREQWIVTMPFEVPADQMKQAYSEAFLRVGTFLDEKGLETVAAPVGVYHEFTREKMVFEAGMPISDRVDVPGDLNMYHIPMCYVATATCVGPYSKLESVHEAIETFIKEHGAEVSGSPWEVYMNNESEVGDPGKLITQVFYPLKEQIKP